MTINSNYEQSEWFKGINFTIMTSFEDASFVGGDGRSPPVDTGLRVEMILTSGITDGKTSKKTSRICACT